MRSGVLVILCVLVLASPLQGGVGICFATAAVGDILTSVGANGRNPSPYTDLFANGEIKAIALSPDGSTLYAADNVFFGFIDMQLGGFVAVRPLGGGLGKEGAVFFDDITGLDFDRTSGILYAAHRRRGALDVLLQLDPLTGIVEYDSFGWLIDYVVIASDSLGPGFSEVDDIALDPSSGQMFASVSHPAGGASRLVLVDKVTGEVTDIGEFRDASDTPIWDMEGLTFSPGGVLYGVTGNASAGTPAVNVSPPENSLWKIDPGSALVRLVGPLTTSTVPRIEDYEGIACLDSTATFGHKVSGHVWVDSDQDGVFDPEEGERGQPGILVRLYQDMDFNGAVSSVDYLLYSAFTDVDGYYEFEVFPWGDYVLETDSVTYPKGASLTTDNVESAVFSSALEVDDSENDFGLDSGPLKVSPPGVCYSVADTGNYFTAIGTQGYGAILVGGLSPLVVDSSVEAIASDATGTLYGIDADVLGTLDPVTGQFAPYPVSLGTASSPEGPLALNPVNGLEFDPATGVLYGSVGRAGGNDVLIQIDPGSGFFVPDAFGPGLDYIELNTKPFGVIEVEDIAIDPADGKMYAAAQDFGKFDQLFSIDKMTGTATQLGFFRDVQGKLVEDVEGLTFSPDGRFYATSGALSAASLAPPHNSLYLVDKATALVSEMGPLIANPHTGDHEAVACLAQGNSISGIVFGDSDLDGVFEAGHGDTATEGALVSLYSDDDASGNVTIQDTLLAQVRTESDGSYEFGAPAFGRFLITIDTTTLPPGSRMIAENLEKASFAAFTDPASTGHDFGYLIAIRAAANSRQRPN